MFAIVIMHLNTLVQIFIAIPGPGGWEIYHDKTNHGTHAGIGANPSGNIRVEVHIVKAGNTTPHHLGNGVSGAIGHKLFIYPLLLCWPYMLIQPGHKW
jgi:hypothetical protein